MPRTGGVYSPPAGTKGVPNTTIQSVPYNTLIDDLAADANAPRPVTAGGTGATSASGARTALGVEIGTNVQAYDAGLQSIAGLVPVADQMIYTTALDVYATTALTPFARTLLDDANASTALTTLGVSDFMKTVLDDGDTATARATLGADNASNLTTGTVSDARLPTTMTAKTFAGAIFTSAIDVASNLNINAASPFLRLNSTDAAGHDYYLYNDGPFKAIHVLADRNQDGTWEAPHPLTLDSVSNVAYTFGQRIATLNGATFTGNVMAPYFESLGSAIRITTIAGGNAHLYFREGAADRGLLYYDASGDGMYTNLYNPAGAYAQTFGAQQDGRAFWTGARMDVGGHLAGSAETRWLADSNSAMRFIAGADNTWSLQWSGDNYGASFRTALRQDASFNLIADDAPAIFANKHLIWNAFGHTAGIQKGTADGGTLAGYNIGLTSWWGVGFPSSLDGVNRVTIDTRTGDIMLVGALKFNSGSTFFSDGNIYMTFYGEYLSNVIMGRSQWWQNLTGSRAYNTTYQNTTGRGIVVSVACYNGAGNPMNFQVSTDGSNWVNVGQSIYDSTTGGPVQNHIPQGPYVVPHGSYYRLTGTGAPIVSFWSEMRN